MGKSVRAAKGKGMLRDIFVATGLGARLMRSSGWVLLGYSVSQAIRLASNLILTRLLYPEAFGLMALITVFLVGLSMLSDIGVAPSIQQSSRGDDPEFKNTAWTIQVIRGIILWILCCILASFAGWLYNNDQLKFMLPVAGLSLLVSGFNPTRIHTASRHLIMGRVTLLDLLSQLISLSVTIFLVWNLESVWALVIGGVLSSVIRLIIMHFLLPGAGNKFQWSPKAGAELIKFGKWIFLSTICGYLLSQGDKAILGKYLTLDSLGIYNVGYFFAGFPQALASVLMSKVMIPLHRECPPKLSLENYKKVRKVRFILTFSVLVMQFTIAFSGIWIVDFLYDQRFAAAGSVVVAVACMNVPYLIGMTYDYSALERGDSQGVFYLLLAKATSQITLFILGMELYGLPGALAGLCLSQILVHPLIIRLAYKHGAWDPWHDFIFGVIGILATTGIVWFHWVELRSLWVLSVAQ